MTNSLPNFSTKTEGPGGLYDHLGYYAEYPPREIKYLKATVDTSYKEYKAAGNLFPRNGSDPAAANLCARSFLYEENRAQIFFTPGADGPTVTSPSFVSIP